MQVDASALKMQVSACRPPRRAWLSPEESRTPAVRRFGNAFEAFRKLSLQPAPNAPVAQERQRSIPSEGVDGRQPQSAMWLPWHEFRERSFLSGRSAGPSRASSR